MDLEHLAEGAVKKGLGLLGTSDFTHPLWFSELRKKLESEGNGFFRLKGSPAPVRFILQTEVSTIFSDRGNVKKVHHLVYSPSLEIVQQLNDRLEKKGNLLADGRPVFGKTTGAELVEICKEISPEMEIIPAHAWTPWFSILGSNSGYDSIAEGYGDQASHIRAFETGMSSDPAMNWRVSSLDAYAQISNSDSHSPYPYRIGRECNAFEFPENQSTYRNVFRAIYSKDANHFKYTVETDPHYGKYHYDGHRNCSFSSTPQESAKLNDKCPKCGRSLVIGVWHRVEALADREPGFVPPKAIPFKTLLPLQELVSSCFRSALPSPRVFEETERLIRVFSNELRVLLEVPEADLKKETHAQLAQAILANRNGSLKVKAGYDGLYGVLELSESLQLEKTRGQKRLKEYD